MIRVLSILGTRPQAVKMAPVVQQRTACAGIQEEATSLGIPTLVLGQTTEQPEGVTAGVLKLVGTDPDLIFNESRRLLEDRQAYQVMAHAENPFGDGHAAEKIIRALLDYQEPSSYNPDERKIQ